MTTARDVIVKAVCHDEQLEIWADEFLEHFLAGDFLRPPETYEDKLSLIGTIKDAIRDIVEKAFDHPELQSDSVRQELAALLNPWRQVETAPKNGAQILAYWRLSNVYDVIEWLDGHWQCDACEVSTPSAWLPLLAPPKEDRPND